MKYLNQVKVFLKDEDGAEFIEYLLVVLILVGLIPTFIRVRDSLQSKIGGLEKAIDDGFQIP